MFHTLRGIFVAWRTGSDAGARCTHRALRNERFPAIALETYPPVRDSRLPRAIGIDVQRVSTTQIDRRCRTYQSEPAISGPDNPSTSRSINVSR